ncbi:hypothetical protein EC973_001633 [Apophysomyces ossiformis]|uniref:Uncharacterized protein n=1 Tax=Apophysomyces ossiformis TaxID=679940 RepID=A0A8H7C078_9FUNG|nr:hypothetical protein EC973_001633 [Apophysomyces ossiformis]
MGETESSAKALEKALRKRAQHEYEFILFEQTDIAERLANTKKRKQQKGDEEEEEQGGQVREIPTELLIAVENDNVFIDGLETSVATHLKHEALKLYNQYLTACDNKRTMISMGLNSILDLTDNYPHGQSALFTRSQYKYLKKRFSAADLRNEISPALEKNLAEIEADAKRGNLELAYRNAVIKQANSTDRDEKFAYYLYAHSLELLLDHANLLRFLAMGETESSAKALEKALRKRAQHEYEFILFEQTDIAERLANTKKRKQQKGDEEEEEQGGQVREIPTELLIAVENDNVFIDGLETSVATHLKHEALKLYNQYLTACDNKRTMISMGLNSILDLTDNYPHGQSALFTRSQYKYLKKRFSAADLRNEISPALEKNLAEIEADAKRGNLELAYRNAVIKQANSTDRDEKFAYYLYAHSLELLLDHAYMFEGSIDLSETDYAIKCWGPVIEHLMARTSVRCKWGDTVCSLHAEKFKVDLRIINDRIKNEHDISQAEFARDNANPIKLSDDHIKVLLEAKQLTDMFHQRYHCDQAAKVAQFYGYEATFCDVVLSADGLYVATVSGRHTWPVSCGQLFRLRSLYITLIAYKNHILRLRELINGAERENTRNQLSCRKLRFANTTSNNQPQKEDKTLWLRDTWMAPRNGGQSLPSLPKHLFSHTGA